MKRYLEGILILVFLLITVIYAEAGETSFYAGIGVGHSKFTGDTINGFEFIPGQRLKDNSEAYDIHIGYQINKYLAVELGYVGFGEVNERFILDPDIDFIVPPKDTLTIKSNGLTITTLLEYPVNDKFNILGLAGFSYMDVDRVISGGSVLGDSSLGVSSSDTENDFLYGAGFKYKIADNYIIGIQWKHYNIKLAETDVTSFILEYQF